MNNLDIFHINISPVVCYIRKNQMSKWVQVP